MSYLILSKMMKYIVWICNINLVITGLIICTFKYSFGHTVYVEKQVFTQK